MARYRNPTGFPSVTQVINPWLATEFFTAEARERGQAVHAAAAAYLRGLFVPPLPKNQAGYFDSFRRWADLRIDKILCVETRFVDPELGISGQPDLIATLRNTTGEPTLVDWKTSQADQKWWRLQIAGYRELVSRGRPSDDAGKPLPNRFEFPPARGGSVRLLATGATGKFHDYSENHNRDFNIFVSAVNVFNFMEG